jgi:drug/metabolite transporter (DMT)-like permease
MNERPRQAGETMGVLLVLVSAASFAALAIFAKLAYKAGGATLPVLNWRFILASLCMAAYFLFSKRNLRLPLRDIGILFLLGALGYGSMSTFFFMSLQYINASTASMFAEGGYEPKDSCMYFGLPTTLTPDVESIVRNGIVKILE